jgi:hypothetical protein
LDIAPNRFIGRERNEQKASNEKADLKKKMWPSYEIQRATSNWQSDPKHVKVIPADRGIEGGHRDVGGYGLKWHLIPVETERASTVSGELRQDQFPHGLCFPVGWNRKTNLAA